jgi:hypothetical protein
MKRTIVTKDGALDIRIEDVGSHRDDVLDALQACAEGRCSCPTPQYAKLDAIEVTPAPDAIAVRLTPKAGESFDVGEIEKCLAYTEERAGKG